MDFLVLFMFILPGFFMEFIYEATMNHHVHHCCPENRPESTWYKFLRSLFFNIPITIVMWLIIWVYKLILHRFMPVSFDQTMSWAHTSAFILHYILVLLAQFLLFYLGCKIYKLIKRLC